MTRRHDSPGRITTDCLRSYSPQWPNSAPRNSKRLALGRTTEWRAAICHSGEGNEQCSVSAGCPEVCVSPRQHGQSIHSGAPPRGPPDLQGPSSAALVELQNLMTNILAQRTGRWRWRHEPYDAMVHRAVARTSINDFRIALCNPVYFHVPAAKWRGSARKPRLLCHRLALRRQGMFFLSSTVPRAGKI